MSKRWKEENVANYIILFQCNNISYYIIINLLNNMEQPQPQQPNITNRIGEFGEKVQESIKPITNVVNNGIENFNQGVSSIKENVGNTLNEFSSKDAVNASNDFLNSNSIIAKFAFIILILILFVFLFNLGVSLILYFTSPSKSPFIVKGLISGSNGMVVTQNPSSSSSIIIQRSNNNKSGIEFTWSVWLYVSNGNNLTTYSHVFNKGDGSWDSQTGIAKVNNGPGLYLINPSSATNQQMGLHVMMDTENTDGVGNSSTQILNISEIPLQKWFNVCIRLENVILDVYLNGTNSGRIIMPYVPRQNYNDINICQNGGFNGNLSDLRYFDHALSVYEINSLMWKGPNLSQNSTAVSTTGTTYLKGTNYISNLWYTSKW